MAEDPLPQKIRLIFYTTAAGSEPVREWLKGLDEAERQAMDGSDGSKRFLTSARGLLYRRRR
jgi:hypothetical protein